MILDFINSVFSQFVGLADFELLIFLILAGIFVKLLLS